MKFFVVALALIATVVAQEMYTTKFDSININEILQSDRLFKNYFNCLTDAGPCTPEGTELKRVLPDALETSCAKCSEKQRTETISAVKFLTENRAEDWKVLKAKYDPNNKYSIRDFELAQKEGITL